MDARISTIVSDAGGNESLENLLYDNANTTANVIQEMRWRSKGNTGNALAYSNPLTASNSTTISHTYGVGGGLTSTTDANNVKTVYSLNACAFTESGNTYYSNPGTVTLASGTPLQRSTAESWDCTTGLLISSTDPNGVITGKNYDSIGRLLQIDEASNEPSAARETNSTYAEANSSAASTTPLVVNTSNDLNNTGESAPTSNVITGGVQKKQTFDQRGQLYLTQTSDTASSTYISAQTLPKLSVSGDGVTYEAVSNPYRTTSDVSMGWTRKKYDQLQRLIAIDHFGAGTPYPWGSNTTVVSGATVSYSSNLTTTTDEAGKVKITAQDAFGRLTSVTEDHNVLNYPTSYTYDFANNLKTVTQSAESRSYTYDSLGHLISATNPENGTLTYFYDPNGNLLNRTDATNQLSITYDVLNRVVLKTYSDTATTKTPWVTYCYDGLTSPSGCSSSPTGSLLVNRLTMVSSNASTSLLTAYDAVGNVLNSQQITGGQTYPFTYTYNKLGEVTSLKYPSNRVVATTYDAAGRTVSASNAVAGNAYGTVPTSSSGYAPNGMIGNITLGNSLLETTTFNSRFQPTQIQVGSLLTLAYGYGTSNNNGNIQTQSILDGSTGVTFNQSFTYDGVNRLTGATETGNWTQTYVFDPYGNRALLSSSSDASTGVPLLLDAVTASTTSVPFGTNNHWNGAGITYTDGRGNLTGASASPNSFSATYDAENRQIQTSSIVGGSTTTANYTYDGDGKRVSKAVTGGATTTYVYDAQGQLSAEYSTETNPELGHALSDERSTGKHTAGHLWNDHPERLQPIGLPAVRAGDPYDLGQPS